MHGNVTEWCIDWYSNDYYAISPLADPGGPEVGTYRVGRGGGWSNSAEHCRSASRRNGAPSDRLDYVGFRLALSPSSEADAQKAVKEAAEEIKRIDSSLPTDPEKTKGAERLDAGLLLAERAYLVLEIAPDQALENARLAVMLNPSLQESCWSLLADLMEARGNGSLRASIHFYQQSVKASDWKEERILLEKSIAADPTFPWSYNDLAWHLATSENPAERNGQEAVKFALKACELDAYHYWGLLDTLAASHAENKEFQEAVKWVTEAIANCDDADDVEEMKKSLERYKAGKSFPLLDGQDEI
jgi:hypothetical protein